MEVVVVRKGEMLILIVICWASFFVPSFLFGSFDFTSVSRSAGCSSDVLCWGTNTKLQCKLCRLSDMCLLNTIR